jgi:hypothetical protein
LFENSNWPDEKLLANRVAALETWCGGAQVHELLDWAISHEWTPARFFAALQSALDDCLVRDENGLLLKNPTL